jgi:hypothetical protein
MRIGYGNLPDGDARTLLIGVIQKELFCVQDVVNQGLCNQTQLGKYILQPNSTDLSKNPIATNAIDLRNKGGPINYSIKKTGYYCVMTHGLTVDVQYRAIVTFRNAYGELPAAQIAKLSFYGGLTIVYAVIGA